MRLSVLSFKRLADEYCRQVGEDECLYKGNHNFDKIDKYRKQYGNWREAPTCYFAHAAKNKDQADKAEDDDMPGHHVGKKTDNEGEGFCEYTEELYGYQDGFYAVWYRGPEDMCPVVFIGAEQDDEERNDTQYQCKSDITCYVG